MATLLHAGFFVYISRKQIAMQKVMEYKMLVDSNAKDFNIQVNEALSKGWELYGNPFSISSDEDTRNSNMCQAVVKYNEKKQMVGFSS